MTAMARIFFARARGRNRLVASTTAHAGSAARKRLASPKSSGRAHIGALFLTRLR